jgi:hypothetical protein
MFMPLPAIALQQPPLFDVRTRDIAGPRAS